MISVMGNPGTFFTGKWHDDICYEDTRSSRLLCLNSQGKWIWRRKEIRDSFSGWSWGPARPFWDGRSYSDEKLNPTATQRRVTSLDAYVDSTSNRKTASCRESRSSSSKQLSSPKTLPFGPRRTGTLGQIPYQGLNLVPPWGFRKYQRGWLLFRGCEVYAVLFFLCYT